MDALLDVKAILALFTAKLVVGVIAVAALVRKNAPVILVLIHAKDVQKAVCRIALGNV